jgi:hypothetical protein
MRSKNSDGLSNLQVSHPKASPQFLILTLLRIRRVKCDEQKPSCLRCSSTGRKCDGYLKELLGKPTDELQTPNLMQRLSTYIPGTTQEKRGFSYFISRTSPELNGFYTTGFWEKLILQASYNEPALRHAVIAIGSLHEDFAQKSLSQASETPSETPSEGISFALNQYTKALGHLRRSLAAGDQKPLTALMSCILFVCFDSLRGFYQSAMVHLQSGMRILRGLRKPGVPEDPVLESTLAPLFIRLSVQAILYVDTSDPSERTAFAHEFSGVVSSEKPTPEAFQTLEEARASMTECADGLFRMFYM